MRKNNYMILGFAGLFLIHSIINIYVQKFYCFCK